MIYYPYINLDLLRTYAVCFYGKIDQYRDVMRNAVKNYDGPLRCNMSWNCNDDAFFIILTTMTKWFAVLATQTE